MFTKLAKLLSPSIRKKEGFTLIELLIVVAIIAILAAIAIPQFSAYRVRGYNTAANSDIRNVKIAEEAFMTDWRGYPSTVGGSSGTGVDGDGALISGPATTAISVAMDAIASGIPSAATSFSFGVSSGVLAVIHTSTPSGANYTMGTSHAQGDRSFGGDSEVATIRYRLKAIGVTMLATDIPSATSADDIPSGATWINM